MLLRVAGVTASVGLADSINPTTVGPGLYLATSERRVLRVTLFTLGVFGVNFVAGVILTIGPGRLLLGLVPHPRGTAKHVIELVAGVVLLGTAVAVWTGRRHLARRELPMSGESAGSGKSALFAGMSIAAVELPTAAPYFAVIAGIVASSANFAQEIGLVALYNLCFVLPLIAIVLLLVFAGDHAEPWLRNGGSWLQRRWPVVLATLLLFVGSALTVLGGTGLVKQ